MILSDWMQERQLMLDLVRQHLIRAKDIMRHQADKKRSEHSFQIGEWVFLKAQPYVQSSLAPRSNQKLAFKFFGPYQILSKMGAVAYKLKLPASSMVHPVFHVSQLKKLVGQHHEVTADIPDHTFQWSVPETIIQRRCITKGTNKIQQVLIKWSNMLVSLATWEDMEPLRQQFPEAAVWGQSTSQERGVSAAGHHQQTGLASHLGPPSPTSASSAQNGVASVLELLCASVSPPA